MENIDPAKRLADNVADIRARMAAAARESGRDPATSAYALPAKPEAVKWFG